MPRAVRFDDYGGLEVLKVVEVDRPTPGPGKVNRQEPGDERLKP